MNRTALIPDLLRHRLSVVFCGTALGAASARAHAYYAGPGNKFWPTLHAVGLTPRRLAPSEYPELLEYGIGLTDLCKTRSGSDRQIGTDAFEPERLARLMAEYQPAWLALTSKQAARHALGVPRIDYGPSDRSVGGVPAFVLPSPSGAANGYWDQGPWQELAALIQAIR